MPKITKPSDHFQIVTYSGNGTANSINVGFQPDLVWIKSRSTATDHAIYDVIRGDKQLFSNSDRAENVANGFAGFSANGFNLDNSGGGGGDANTAGRTYVSWCWKAGGAPVANTDGTIPSQVSVNKEAGFSIITYTGNGVGKMSVGHGLGTPPKFIMIKERHNNNDWMVNPDLHNNRGNYLHLNDTNGYASYPGMWGDAPTNTVFSTDHADPHWNRSGGNYVAYCWAEVEGYSKIGEYRGNSNDDGVFVYTGFAPKFVMIKSKNALSWQIWDSARDGGVNTGSRNWLYPNQASADDHHTPGTDFLSNGFKLRSSGADVNPSDTEIVYMAFAEAPFKYANAR